MPRSYGILLSHTPTLPVVSCPPMHRTCQFGVSLSAPPLSSILSSPLHRFVKPGEILRALNRFSQATQNGTTTTTTTEAAPQFPQEMVVHSGNEGVPRATLFPPMLLLFSLFISRSLFHLFFSPLVSKKFDFSSFFSPLKILPSTSSVTGFFFSSLLSLLFHTEGEPSLLPPSPSLH